MLAPGLPVSRREPTPTCLFGRRQALPRADLKRDIKKVVKGSDRVMRRSQLLRQHRDGGLHVDHHGVRLTQSLHFCGIPGVDVMLLDRRIADVRRTVTPCQGACRGHAKARRLMHAMWLLALSLICCVFRSIPRHPLRLAYGLKTGRNRRRSAPLMRARLHFSRRDLGRTTADPNS